MEIFTISKRYSVFIQTDKPMYKPGDTVKFRVLIIDAETKPYQVDKLSVELLDARGNVVTHLDEHNQDNLSKGVYVNEFEVAAGSVIGKWKIRVTSSSKRKNDVTEHHVAVKKFVLPQFVVNVDTKNDVSQDEGAMQLVISANYTFGEYVKGKAVITARVYDPVYPKIIQQTVSKAINVDRKATVEFGIKKDLQIFNEIRRYDVVYEVVFEDVLTGQQETKIVPVGIHQIGEHFLEIVTASKRFKPGFPYDVKVIVRKFDGTLSENKLNRVKLTTDFYYKASTCMRPSATINLSNRFESNKETNLINGIAEFSLRVPANTTDMAITAQFFDDEVSVEVNRQESKSHEYLVLKSLTKR